MTETFQHSATPLSGIHINTAVSLRRRSRWAAALLGMFLGGFGAHRYYLGYRRLAALQLTVTICTLGVGALWGVAEGWLILLGTFGRDAQGLCLTQRTDMQLLAASLGSLTVHAGMALGAVWLSHHYGPTLVPPPSGVNSVAIALSIPADAAEPAPREVEITVEPPSEAEALELLDKIERLEPLPTEQSQGLPELESLAGPGPTPLPAAEIEQASTQRRDPSASSPMAMEAPPIEPVAKAEMNVTPTTSQSTAASAASSASTASQANQGFDTDALPSKVEFPQPVYPAELRRRGITGLVKLRVRVGVDGRVRTASVYRTSGHAEFDRAALEVIRRWRFEPARQAGVAVEMEIAVPIRFVIEESPK